ASINRNSLEAGNVSVDGHVNKILDADYFSSNAFGRLIYVVERCSASTGGDVVNSIFQVVLIVVVMTEEPGGDVIFLEQHRKRSHVRIVTLAGCDCSKRWVMGYNEPIVGFLMRFQIIFDPT